MNSVVRTYCSVSGLRIGRRIAAYRKPYEVGSKCSRGALSFDGRGQLVCVAFAPSTCAAGISVECKLELCAESIEPSSTCAQLHAACIFTIEMLAPLDHAGGCHSAAGCGPIQIHTNPPPSRTA